MLKQWMSQNALTRSLLWFAMTCLVVLSLVACESSSGTNSVPPVTPSATPSPTPTLSPTQTPRTAPFKVTGIDMAVNPTSIAGLSCGTNITVIYTATFHIVPNSPGGTIEFLYTWNNGRASPSASVNIDPGQTRAIYTFTWSGQLSPDHVLPGAGGVMVSSPNVINSPLVRPEGFCQ